MNEMVTVDNRPEGYIGVGNNLMECLIEDNQVLIDNGSLYQNYEMVSNAMKAKSYKNALDIINTYVKILDKDYINGPFSEE